MTASRPRTQPQSDRPARVRPGPSNRRRAAKACRRCNEKRVKCDASEKGTPCTRCVDRGEDECTLIQSRRGMYERKPREPRQKSKGSKKSQVRRDEEEDPIIHDEESITLYDSDGQIMSHVGDSQSNAGLETSPSQQLEGYAGPGQLPPQEDALRDGAQYNNLPADQDTSPVETETSDVSSYREITWAAMFSHLLEGRHRGEDVVDKGSITYLGESFPLAIVLKELAGAGGTPKLHHPGPPRPANDDLPEPRGLQHPAYMQPEDLAFLEAKKAFETPEKPTLDALVDVFVNRIFPMYPIVNRDEFIDQYNAKRTPWMLLHAVCFISATFCPSHIIHKIGFDSRREARWLFYRKAKALFDVGYESDKIIALQVSIMMTFWGGGPNMYWNFYSWISTGVTIAETLGCHRSMAGANIKPQDRSLLKRLWWVLVIRDTLCSTLVGRPFRINLDHSDVDALTLDDFKHDVSPTEFGSNPLAHCFGLYQIAETKLSLVLRQIVMCRFSPGRDAALRASSLKQMLAEWRAELPKELSWAENSSRHANILTSCLCIQYNNHMILAHLNSPIEIIQSDPSRAAYPQLGSDDISNEAAQQIAATACAVVTKSEILMAPHELHHGIFIAAVVFYKQAKSQQPMVAQLGMAGLTNCQMVLHDTREAWDPSPWVQNILDKVLNASTAEDSSQMMGDNQPQTDTTEVFVNNDNAPILDGTGVFSTGFELWQGYPALGNLFDIPLTGSVMPMTPNFGERPCDTSWT